MFTIFKGVGLLLITLAVFSVFSMKAPKGSEAMSGMANAAIASFLVEAVHKYILGDVLALEFFHILGATSGSMGGVAAAITVPLAMGVNPVFTVTAGLALGGFGILPGFIAGYLVGLDYMATAIRNETVTFPQSAGGILSLFCFGKDATVTLRGLQYELEDGLLQSSFPLGVSNHFVGKQVILPSVTLQPNKNPTQKEEEMLQKDWWKY